MVYNGTESHDNQMGEQLSEIIGSFIRFGCVDIDRSIASRIRLAFTFDVLCDEIGCWDAVWLRSRYHIIIVGGGSGNKDSG